MTAGPGVRAVSRTGLYARSSSALAIRARKVRRLVERLRVTMPWLEPSDLPACRAWAELEVLSASAFAALTTDGLTNAEGEPRRLLSEFRQLRQAQLAYERELGMTPAARTNIRASSTHAALDLAQALANGAGGQESTEGNSR